MRGKETCKALREIRRQIAEQNDIEFAVSECTHQGDCKGTCPKCEAELRYLERQLELKKSLGKAVAIVGISAGVCTGMTACSPADTLKTFFPKTGEEVLAGDVQTAPPEDLDDTLGGKPTDKPLQGEMEEPEVLSGDIEIVDEPLDGAMECPEDELISGGDE